MRCPKCQGKGYVERSSGSSLYPTVWHDPCQLCKGTGKLLPKRRRKVKELKGRSDLRKLVRQIYPRFRQH